MDLRAAWESELRKFGIDPDTDWGFLDWLWETVAGDHAFEIQAGADNVLESMVEAARRPCITLVQFSRGGNGGGRSSGSSNAGGGEDLSGQIRFDTKTKTHVKALSEYLSKIAAIEPRVMEFRRRHLGGPTATVILAEVPHILESWSIAPGDEKDEDVYLYWTGEKRLTKFRGGYWSSIGTLDRLGDYLANKYPWNKDQALHFVLCGGVWQSKTVSGRRQISKDTGPAAHRFARCTISLEVEAWMPPELVKKAYARFQREARERGGSFIGPATTTRRGYGRTAEVFRFVVGQSKLVMVNERENLGKLVLPGTGKWRDLRKQWDDHLPADHAWRYGEIGWRNFHRDFMRGQKAVIGNRWGLPGYPGQPMTAEEAIKGSDEFIKRLSAQVEQSESASKPF